jgi:hypothetical protein
MQVLIYRNDEGRICVITPAPEYADQIISVGVKDIPLGKPFKLVDVSELPVDTPREEWVFDDATFTAGAGARA